MSPMLLTILSSNPSIKTLAQMVCAVLITLSNNLMDGPDTAQTKISLRKTACQWFHPILQTTIKIAPQATAQSHPLAVMLSTAW